MKRHHWMILTVVVLVVGAACSALLLAQARGQSNGNSKMKTMTIKWQRVVGEKGQTCDRCGSTQAEVRKAHALLRKSLSPLGINVLLEEKTLDKATAAKNITESNRIWVAGKPLETWLCASTGASDCKSCESLCGGNVQCRTVVVGGGAYETIPSPLIVKAGLLAAAEIVGTETARTLPTGWNSSGPIRIIDDTGGAGGCCPR